MERHEVRCKNKLIDREVLCKVFASSFNTLVENKEEFKETWKAKDGDEIKRYRSREIIEIIGDGVAIEESNINLYFKMIEKMRVFEDKVVISFMDGFYVA